jgi:hypothetical protein
MEDSVLKPTEIIAGFNLQGRRQQTSRQELEHFKLFSDTDLNGILLGVIIFLMLFIYLVFELPPWLENIGAILYGVYCVFITVLTGLCGLGVFYMNTGNMTKTTPLVEMAKQMLTYKGRFSALVGMVMEIALLTLCVYTQAYYLATVVVFLAVAVMATRILALNLGYVLLGAARVGQLDYDKVVAVWQLSKRKTV